MKFAVLAASFLAATSQSALAGYCDALYGQLAQVQLQERSLDDQYPLTRAALEANGQSVDTVNSSIDYLARMFQNPEVIAKCALLGNDNFGNNWCDVYWRQKRPLMEQRQRIRAMLRENNCA